GGTEAGFRGFTGGGVQSGASVWGGFGGGDYADDRDRGGDRGLRGGAEPGNAFGACGDDLPGGDAGEQGGARSGGYTGALPESVQEVGIKKFELGRVDKIEFDPFR